MTYETNRDTIERLERHKLLLQNELPHLYSFPWYKWSKDFFESRDKVLLCCAANQISKSSTQIRKVIHWATASKLWPELWRNKPLQFWYLYPTAGVATIEFNKKWVPEYMPRGSMKDHPLYGWEAEMKQREVHAIHFKSGVSVYFKTYSQSVQHLQSGTVNYIACDEELPVSLYDELMLRLAATDGYFSMVFTATLGQEFWRRAIECRGRHNEVLKEAKKIQVAMYDCLEYWDGDKNTPWTEERIAQIKGRCKSEAEVLRRVYGRFVKDVGLKYPSFSRTHNVIRKMSPKKFEDWLVYSGVDIGSGGQKGHPAAITFVAVRPDMKRGVVFRGWRGDGVVTTASDILMKYRQLRGRYRPILECYDWQAKDFHIYATRLGETFTPAEKGHELGEDMLNVLFKSKMLKIFELDDLEPLMEELESLNKDTLKSNAKDDFVDSLRYAVTRIPWDWSAVDEDIGEEKKEPERELTEVQRRREFIFDEANYENFFDGVTEVMDECNELLSI